MPGKALVQLYAEHVANVSGKWSTYFNEYDRIIGAYRHKPVRLLAIGNQNGGSLGIWARYFPHAQKLVGCGTRSSPDSASVNDQDPRIAVVVGDAASDTTQAAVLRHAPAFDVIMADGSDRSSDIVKSFAAYFPHLADDGVFLADHLYGSHGAGVDSDPCGPRSALAFFRRLADVIGCEQRGHGERLSHALRDLYSDHGLQRDEGPLPHVHSVEFIDSMCVIRKAIGERPRHVVRPPRDPDSIARGARPDEELTKRPGSPSGKLAAPDGQFVIPSKAVPERGAQSGGLARVVLPASGHATDPDRRVGHEPGRLERVVTFAPMALATLLNVPRLIFKAGCVCLREGIGGAEERLALLHSDQYVKQLERHRGLSPRILGGLIAIATVLVRLKQWWLADEKRRWLSDRASHFLRGDVRASRRIARGALRVQVDQPRIGVFTIVKDACLVSGWAVDLEARAPAQVRLVVGGRPQPTDPRRRDDVRRVFAPVCELPIDTGFACRLSLPVGVFPLRIEVEGVDGSWMPVRRAVLVRVPGKSRVHEGGPKLSYGAWARLEQKRLKAETPDIKRHIDVMVQRPAFTVVVDTRHGAGGLEDTLTSIRRQLYPSWDVRVLCDPVASSLPDGVRPLTDRSLSDIAGDFVVFVRSGQRLAANALYEFAAAINQWPESDLIYGDEDSVSASGRRCEPFHKPGWAPDYLETFNYIGFPACFRATLARGCFESGHVYDFVLRFTERTVRVCHVPKILGHGVAKGSSEGATSVNAAALDVKALSGRLARTGRRGTVLEHEMHKGCYVSRLLLRHSPLVSAVIPTAGRTVSVGGRRIDLIANVISQLRERSTYSNVEVIVVDNGDLSPGQLRVLAEAGCRRVTYREPLFNVARKLNLGVSVAKGEFLLLLNDDIEILEAAWIERLLEHFEKPHVGVVGAKLLYPNEETQHVGVVHNFGHPDHVRRRSPRDDEGYFFSTCGVRNYAAVTGACMMTRASVYRAVGGYSEELAVNFNDVDFCMKVRRRGLSVVYAPGAELTHMESTSRDLALDMKELELYERQWAGEVVSDPFYNDRFLSVGPPSFVPCVNERMV